MDMTARRGPLTGRAQYEADVRLNPTYENGRPRHRWEELDEVQQWSWSRPNRPEPEGYQSELTAAGEQLVIPGCNRNLAPAVRQLELFG